MNIAQRHFETCYKSWMRYKVSQSIAICRFSQTGKYISAEIKKYLKI
jgi:hypothetical protein